MPAPKKTAAMNAPKKGVSLKTSSEAAFSRERPEMPTYDEPAMGAGNGIGVEERKEEPLKLVGKATRFLPLSVSSKKKKKGAAGPKAMPAVGGKGAVERVEKDELRVKEVEAAPKPKVKKSLFSVQQEEEPVEAAPATESYEPLIHQEETPEAPPPEFSAQQQQQQQQSNPSSLSTAASDLNLTAAQKRHLFGRKGNADVNITHFNMDSEYQHNEKLRQDGAVTEHRAVKAIAPGKHSLQQLVNNAKTQKDGLEDAWAEGKRNRGEGSSKYGWGK